MKKIFTKKPRKRNNNDDDNNNNNDDEDDINNDPTTTEGHSQYANTKSVAVSAPAAHARPIGPGVASSNLVEPLLPMMPPMSWC